MINTTMAMIQNPGIMYSITFVALTLLVSVITIVVLSMIAVSK